MGDHFVDLRAPELEGLSDFLRPKHVNFRHFFFLCGCPVRGGSRGALPMLGRAAGSVLLSKLGSECDTIHLVPHKPQEEPTSADFKAAVGKRVRNLREARAWSQIELARRLGYRTKTQIVKIESGDVPATLDLVDRLARVFELPGGAVEFLAINPPMWPQLGDDADLQKIIDAKQAQAAQEALDREDLELDATFLEALTNRVNSQMAALDDFKKDMTRIQVMLHVWIQQSRSKEAGK